MLNASIKLYSKDTTLQVRVTSVIRISDAIILLRNTITDNPKACRFEISRPGLRFVSVYMRTVPTHTSTKVTRLRPATDTKSDGLI